MRTASAFTLSIAKGTPLLLGRGAACAADARRLQFRPDLVVEILRVARPGLDRLPVPETERVEAVVAVLAPGHRAAAVVLVACPAELLGGVVRHAAPEVELAPLTEVPRPVEIDQSALGAARFDFPHGTRPARLLAGDAQVLGLAGRDWARVPNLQPRADAASSKPSTRRPRAARRTSSRPATSPRTRTPALARATPTSSRSARIPWTATSS